MTNTPNINTDNLFKFFKTCYKEAKDKEKFIEELTNVFEPIFSNEYEEMKLYIEEIKKGN